MAETNETAEGSEALGGDRTEQNVGSEQNESAEKPKEIPQEQISEEGPRPAGTQISKDTRIWAMFCHLVGLAWLLSWIVPLLGGVIGTLILWQIKKDEHSFIDEHGREAFNFQSSMLIYAVIAGLLIYLYIGFVLLPVVVIMDIVFAIIAAVKANNGKHYRYPLTIRFIGYY